MRNLLFYQYREINDLPTFRESHLQLLRSLELKGKVLIATEGINGCVTGSEERIKEYRTELAVLFPSIDFKETPATEHNFKKIIVRIRPEIVTSKTTVTLENSAPYIEPSELKALLDNNEDVILLDARNNYESEIGRFKGAITPDIDVFSQFTKVAQDLSNLKDKQIVTYCTGGIRCEKASAVLKENGFTNVRQLHGGIIKYGEEMGNSHWEGTCFVFDTRGSIPIHPEGQSQPISHCHVCRVPADKYYNCARERCNDMFISCADCNARLANYCSKNCMNRHAFEISKGIVKMSAKVNVPRVIVSECSL